MYYIMVWRMSLGESVQWRWIRKGEGGIGRWGLLEAHQQGRHNTESKRKRKQKMETKHGQI
jgi:hypothetical protein